MRHLRRVRHVKAAPWKRAAAVSQPHTQHTSIRARQTRQATTGGRPVARQKKRVRITLRGQQAVKHSQGYRALTSPPPPTPPPTPPQPQKYPANALEAVPRSGLLLLLLPRGLRVSVPEVRRRELGEQARVLVGPRPRWPTVLGQWLGARHCPHGTTKTAAVRTRRAGQATARASAISELTGPRCGRAAAIRDRWLQKRLRSVLALCHLKLKNL